MSIIEQVIQQVPDYRQFMTVEELNTSSKRLKEQFPQSVDLFEAGRSTSGEPILCLKIGEGRRSALLYGFPHPNEPVGSVMLDYLSWKLAESKELRDIFDFTWYIVKVADVDGAKLNEGWFKKPYSFRQYVYNYYRPAGNEQVEWSFPIEYKTLKFDKPTPETQALMNIIEQRPPSFIYSLHNAGFGGVYYYISEDAPLLYPIFEKAAKDRNVPLSLGEPEIPYAKQFHQAVFLMPTTTHAYDYYEKYASVDPATIIMCGESSVGYAKRFNRDVFELVCEVPYYYDERIENTKPTKINRRKLVLEELESNKKDMEHLISIYEKIKNKIDTHTKFQDALEYFMESFKKSYQATLHWAQTAEELERNATVAEKFDNQISSKSYSLLKWGMLYRLVKSQRNRDQILLKTANKIRKLIDSRMEILEKKTKFNVIPIRKLVQIQLTAGLYSSLYTSLKR
ncbi:MAG: M14 family zinc carboxypeptidase [Pseudothermotoga sp.]